MGIARTITGWASGKPIAISEAEIREELEFHLEMRARDNVLAGMSQEEAQIDARQRFGDFEQQYKACRQIAIGLPLAIRRVQVGLLLALSAAVIWQGIALSSAQEARTEYESQLEQLRIELASQSSSADPVEASHIPYVRSNSVAIAFLFNLPAATETAAPTTFEPSKFDYDTLEQPWSDWQSLPETPLPVSEVR